MSWRRTQLKSDHIERLNKKNVSSCKYFVYYFFHKQFWGHNACNGDSGGSAAKSVMVNGVKRMYLFGVASYVQADCQGGAIYTNVLFYLDFILNGIKKG